MYYCTECGHQIDEDSIFCSKCGTKADVELDRINNISSSSGNKVNQVNNKSISNPIETPTFEPPHESGGVIDQSDIPVFEPPKKDIGTGMQGDIPTFMPPEVQGEVCFYHDNELSVATCTRCGKNLCSDCFDAYRVEAGEYAGQALCYDCCRQLVSENVAELTKNKNKIKIQFIVSIVGIVIGFIVGLSAGLGGGIVGAAIGGVFLSALKVFFVLVWDVIKITVSGRFGVLTVISIMWNILVLIVKCMFLTISNTIYYINYLKETSGFIESDQTALRQMEDYMEYTLIRNQNRGVDIETLLKQESELADNSFAQMVQAQGDEQAEAILRECVATINENGEIIRSFHEGGRVAA